MVVTELPATDLNVLEIACAIALDRISDFITKHYKLWLVIFAIMLLPAIHGNNNYER